MKNNFAQALKELTGFDSPTGETVNAFSNAMDDKDLKADYYTPTPSEQVI